MMDEVVADPAGKQLWGGNEGGLFRMVPIERVVEDIVNGIERRSRKIVTPRSNAACRAARCDGPSGRADRLPRRHRPKAIELAAPSGWHADQARDRTVGN